MIFECQSTLTLHRVRTALYTGCFQVFLLSAVQDLDWLLLHKLETIKKVERIISSLCSRTKYFLDIQSPRYKKIYKNNICIYLLLRHLCCFKLTILVRLQDNILLIKNIFQNPLQKYLTNFPEIYNNQIQPSILFSQTRKKNSIIIKHASLLFLKTL